jgi:hypothetical protein
MVLIHPVIMADPSHVYGGKLLITFPEGSGCDSFEIPLSPSKDILDTWEMQVYSKPETPTSANLSFTKNRRLHDVQDHSGRRVYRKGVVPESSRPKYRLV